MSRAEELIALFDMHERRYHRAEVEEALTRQDEITPLLIDILERIADDSARYIDEDHNAEMYAVALLAHFREEKAHMPLIRAFSLPEEQLDYIWGDMVTETLPALLCRTAGGDYTAIMELARDRSAFGYVRTAALEAIKLGIASGDLPREKGIELFSSLFDESLAEPGDYFWGSLVSDLLDMYPDELISNIRDLFAKGFVDEGFVSISEVNDVMAQGRDAAMTELQRTQTWRLPEDVHDYMAWFASSQEPKRTATKSSMPATNRSAKTKKNRKKEKQAKAARRRNR